MPVIDAKQISKSYGADTVLDRVNLTIESGERLGLVGINGCGKSTLARVLTGAESADSGEIIKRRGAEIAFLGQTAEVDPNRTALQEALSGLREWSRATFPGSVANNSSLSSPRTAGAWRLCSAPCALPGITRC